MMRSALDEYFCTVNTLYCELSVEVSAVIWDTSYYSTETWCTVYPLRTGPNDVATINQSVLHITSTNHKRHQLLPTDIDFM